MNKIGRQSVDFVPISDIVPSEWKSWFYQALSTDAPFSWGDNNRTLVTASRILDFVDEWLDYYEGEDGYTEESCREFREQLENLGELYIDLEN